MKDKGERIKQTGSPRPTLISSFRLYPLSFLNSMHSAAFRRFRLVAARQPVRIFSWTVAFHFELRTAHILELDLNRIAGIHRPQPLMKGAGGNDVSRTELNKFCQPGDLFRNFVSHVFRVVVLSWLSAGPRLHHDIVRIRNLVFGDDPRPTGGMAILTLGNELGAPHHAAG